MKAPPEIELLPPAAQFVSETWFKFAEINPPFFQGPGGIESVFAFVLSASCAKTLTLVNIKIIEIIVLITLF